MKLVGENNQMEEQKLKDRDYSFHSINIPHQEGYYNDKFYSHSPCGRKNKEITTKGFKQFQDEQEDNNNSGDDDKSIPDEDQIMEEKECSADRDIFFLDCKQREHKIISYKKIFISDNHFFAQPSKLVDQDNNISNIHKLQQMIADQDQQIVICEQFLMKPCQTHEVKYVDNQLSENKNTQSIAKSSNHMNQNYQTKSKNSKNSDMATFKPDYRMNYDSIADNDRSRQLNIERSQGNLNDNIALVVEDCKSSNYQNDNQRNQESSPNQRRTDIEIQQNFDNNQLYNQQMGFKNGALPFNSHQQMESNGIIFEATSEYKASSIMPQSYYEIDQHGKQNCLDNKSITTKEIVYHNSELISHNNQDEQQETGGTYFFKKDQLDYRVPYSQRVGSQDQLRIASFDSKRKPSNQSRCDEVPEEPAIISNAGGVSHRSKFSNVSAKDIASKMLNFIKIDQKAKKNLNIQATIQERIDSMTNLKNTGVLAQYYSYTSSLSNNYQPSQVKINLKNGKFIFIKIQPRSMKKRMQGCGLFMKQASSTVHKIKFEEIGGIIIGPQSVTFQGLFHKNPAIINQPWQQVNQGRSNSIFRRKRFSDLQMQDKNVKAPRIVKFRIMKERFKCIALQQKVKLQDLFYKMLISALENYRISNQEEKNEMRERALKNLKKRLEIDEKSKQVSQYPRITYIGTSDKNIQDMDQKQFENYLNHCKKDLVKSYNISKKFYLHKFLQKNDLENRLFMMNLELNMSNYIKRKLKDIDQKMNPQSRVNACMALKDYYERFCDRKDNPTFNMLEVELKREINEFIEQIPPQTTSINNGSQQIIKYVQKPVHKSISQSKGQVRQINILNKSPNQLNKAKNGLAITNVVLIEKLGENKTNNTLNQSLNHSGAVNNTLNASAFANMSGGENLQSLNNESSVCQNNENIQQVSYSTVLKAFIEQKLKNQQKLQDNKELLKYLPPVQTPLSRQLSNISRMKLYNK
ncbi:UNKNOWN [Stylonychia lemnae]|uniref:Uncharacterized protein n=1 Tax=Stylonychia lemnae TaxID=5949 RepID=A0A078A660_STYLE|nr:UNKNOWN [Stylonychia lemnae]|eukprot:CDW77050.1 UNKNOWN [Stylonychia lemnae]